MKRSKEKFIRQFNQTYGFDFDKGCCELGISKRQLLRLLSSSNTSVPTMTICILMDIISRGYLPSSGPWSEFKINRDNVLETPYGFCNPSDVSLVHSYKWSSQQNSDQYRALKEKTKRLISIDEVQNELLDLVAKLSDCRNVS